ncbi:MAG: PIG-L family deacetylase, partial [Acidobacteria bacterium]|nr:PIG-L family deacetylase [Acidobacteriota bacterium]
MSLRSIIRLLFAGGLLVCLTGGALAAKHTVLVVMAHRDDHLSIAPLLAKYAAEGHTVHFAMFTGLQDDTREELMCASRVLGVKETFVMRPPTGDANATARRVERAGEKAFAERMIQIIDQTRPDVIVTWGPDGLSGHPGHILVSNLITRLFQQQALLKHKPRKLYYVAYPETRLPDKRLPIGVLASGSDQGEELAGPFGTVSDIFITTRIDGRSHLKQTREAIACFTIPKGELNKEWQNQWYERLATTLGGTVSLRRVMPASGGRETDIFKGL